MACQSACALLRARRLELRSAFFWSRNLFSHSRLHCAAPKGASTEFVPAFALESHANDSKGALCQRLWVCSLVRGCALCIEASAARASEAKETGGLGASSRAALKSSKSGQFDVRNPLVSNEARSSDDTVRRRRALW